MGEFIESINNIYTICCVLAILIGAFQGTKFYKTKIANTRFAKTVDAVESAVLDVMLIRSEIEKAIHSAPLDGRIVLSQDTRNYLKRQANIIYYDE